MKILLKVIFISLGVSLFSFDITLANFSNTNYSIKIEKDKKRVIEINSFDNGKVSKLFRNLNTGIYKVFLKNIPTKDIDSQAKAVFDWVEIDEIIIEEKDQNKKYLAYINYHGLLSIFDIEPVEKNNFLFINETGRELTVLKIADEWEEENFGFIKYDMDSGFYNVKEGKWYIMWRYKDDEKANRYFYVKDKNYEKKLIDFSNKRIIFIIYQDKINELYSFFDIKF